MSVDVTSILQAIQKTGQPSNDARLLVTRAIIEQALNTQRPIECCQLYNWLSPKVSKFLSDRPDGDVDEPSLIGILNLFAEHCRSSQDGTWPCRACRDRAFDDVQSGATLLHVLCLPANGGFIEAFEKHFSLDQGEFDDWKNEVSAQATHWESLLTPKSDDRHCRQRPGETDLCQTLAMHVLDRILPCYEPLKIPRDRAAVHVVLVPLLRTVFRNPDRAHVVYQRYFFGWSGSRNVLFHRLYGKFLFTTETLKSQSAADCQRILEDLSEGKKKRGIILDEILHGKPEAQEYEALKRTAICQLSLLVKGADDGETPLVRYEASQLDHQLLLPMGDRWQPADGTKEAFRVALEEVYRDGHDRAELSSLFATDRKPAWIHDGELTFAALVANAQVGGEANSDGWAVWSARLFGGDGNVSNKGWALVNFLERAAVHDRPRFYSREKKAPGGHGEAARQVIEVAYKKIWDVPFTRSSLTNAFTGALDAVMASARDAKWRLRADALKPEYLLRRDCEPLSLFFYPIAGAEEKDRSSVLPELLLGGTVGGIGAGELPDVGAAHDYHLIAALDAAGPVIDAELAGVVHERLRDVERAKQEVLQREVAPVVKQMADLFETAKGQLARIEATVDSDWSGLFADALASSIAEVFDDHSTLDFERVPGLKDCGRRRGNHDMPSTQHEFLKELLYITYTRLLPQSDKYGEIATCKQKAGASVVALAEGWRDSEIVKHLKLRQPWMVQLLDFAAKSTNVDHARLLLKLITLGAVDPKKPLHPVQVLVALGLGGRSVQFWIDDTEQYGNFDLSGQSVAVGALGAVFEKVPAKSGLSLRRTISPARFLRALRTLITGPLAGRREVKFERSGIRWDSVGRLLILVRCSGQFPEDVHREIAEYAGASDERYHDLRLNLKTVWEAVGGYPLFTEHQLWEKEAPDWAGAANLLSSFSIVESCAGAERRTLLAVRLGTESCE